MSNHQRSGIWLVALVLAAAVLVGCTRHDCSSSLDCKNGRVCVHQHTPYEIDQDTCESLCTSTRLTGVDAGCDAGAICTTGDMRAKDDDGNVVAFCMP